MCRFRYAATRPWRRHAAIPGPAYIAATVTIPPHGASRLPNVLRSGRHLGHPTAMRGLPVSKPGLVADAHDRSVSEGRAVIGKMSTPSQHPVPAEISPYRLLDGPPERTHTVWRRSRLSALTRAGVPARVGHRPRPADRQPFHRDGVPRVTTGSRRRGGASAVSPLASPEDGTGGQCPGLTARGPVPAGLRGRRPRRALGS
jgi:hypothetical protein